MLSIIIPTYNEGKNIILVVNRIEKALKNLDYEIIFVDDSEDGTLEYLEELCQMNQKVKYFHRENERGLATAVIYGFKKAKGNIISVMDADLQHPPELLVSMFSAIEKGADIVIPSRFIKGGNDWGLNIFRKLVSYTARKIASVLIKKLRKFSDSTSGYFMMNKNVIENALLDPVGWKILIEVLVKGNYEYVIEIPYKFQSRSLGQSKMSIKEQINYLKHIWRILKNSPKDLRFILFCLVGLSGVVVNLIIYTLFVKVGVNVTMAALISSIIAMTTNFLLNNFITWKDVKKSSIFERVTKNIITSTFGIGINLIVLIFLYKHLKINYILSNFLAIMVSTIWNYIINNNWTWKTKEKHQKLKIELWAENKTKYINNI